jgi:hypothetical protein
MCEVGQSSNCSTGASQVGPYLHLFVQYAFPTGKAF